MYKNLLLAFAIFLPLFVVAGPSRMTFSCDATNDVYSTLRKNGHRFPRFATPLEAVTQAPTNSAVLILADEYPSRGTRVESGTLELAARKKLNLYVEFPESLPGLEFGPVRRTAWERGIVASKSFGTALPEKRILALHDCHFRPVSVTNALLVIGRVAGFDTAVFGLPKESFPVLFELPDRKMIVATTKLSHFITARYAPADDWQTIWREIFARLGWENADGLKSTPLVAPAFAAGEKLPKRFEKKAFDAGVNWIFQSRLLVTSSRKAEIEKALVAGAETTIMPSTGGTIGDGSLGILEGYSSGILHDGTQMQRLPLRADCNAESAMVLAFGALVNRDKRSAGVAANLLDYTYFDSGMCGGVRADPKHPAYGLIAWGAIAPNWVGANYGDDNARVLQATMLAAVCLKSEKWNDALAKGILANFRTTGKLGFRGDRMDNPELEKRGWKSYRDAETVNHSPHFESGMWACYLWAYRETGFRPFLDQTKTAIAMTMKECPDGWRWGDNMVERARMLLTLAWLVRVEDTPEHRQWLMTVADGLLRQQQSSGAIQEWVTSGANSHYHFPESNEAYGTTETPLIQQNGDPASDQLYTTGFALLALHEAVAATDDARLKKAEDKLAEFLCRIQIRSDKHPWLDGWWFRAFDDRRWEYWASSADAGWGAWSIEAGWAQAWTVAALGLREVDKSFWDITKNSGTAKSIEKYRSVMLEEEKRAGF